MLKLMLRFTNKFEVVESDLVYLIGFFVVEKKFFSIAQMVSGIILSEETRLCFKDSVKMNQKFA
jgi:hypothetical protein